LRAGSRECAEENASYRLTTLTERHVSGHDGVVHFDFPAKSGKQATAQPADRAVMRVAHPLAQSRPIRSTNLFDVAVTARMREGKSEMYECSDSAGY